MTPDQIHICKSLGRVRYLPGSFDKRFGNNLASLAENNPDEELTAKQIEWMYRLLYKYRKQLPSTYEDNKHQPFCSYKRQFLPQTV